MSEKTNVALTAEEIAKLIATEIKAYHQRGPNLRTKHLKLACEEFSEETINALWDDAEAKRPPKPVAEPSEVPLAPQIDAGLSVSGKPSWVRIGGKQKVTVAKPVELISTGIMDKLRAIADEEKEYPQEEEVEAETVEAEAEPEPKRNLPALIPSRQPATWNDAIAAMNEQHAIIDNVGNRTVIASWEPSPINLDRRMLVFQGKDSFLLRHSNRSVSIEVSDGRGGMRFDRAPLGQWWLGHRDRRQHRGVTFRPGAPEVVSECLNMWQGWGVVPEAGDWSLIRWHIEELIAGGNPEFAEYVIRWIAWSVQNPAAQAEVALVLIGHKGAGKGTLVRALQRIFGAHAFQVTSREEVIGKFNGHLQDCVLFVADEAYWGGDKRCVGRLQGMITEPTLPIERKGFDLILVPNYLHVVMLAEPGWVIPAGRYERRYAALSVSDVRRGNGEYFKALHHQIADGGAEAMMWDLQRLDLDGWHPREIPESLLKGTALQQQQAHTLPPLEQWYLSLLQDGRVPGALINLNPKSKKISRPNTAYTKSLREDAIERFPRLRWELSDNALADFMTDQSWPKAQRFRNNKNNGWTFEPLKESREAFDQRYGPRVWSEAKDWGDCGVEA
jgi:Family of unknown function (DUF5906)